MKKEEGRKTRSDKKKHIAPYIPDEQRVWIHRIARHCEQPEGEIGLRLIQAALEDENCIVFFSNYFRRDYRFSDNILYCGHDDAISIYDYLIHSEQRDRYKVKPKQSLYNQLCEFQIALGIPFLAHAAYALLQYALHDIHTVQKVCPNISKHDFQAPHRPFITSPAAPATSNLKLAPIKETAVKNQLVPTGNSSVWSILN
ncbi:hypothetical protein RB620_24840 [Paenibacillus sp. LHD-117]|uniref:hypothetical protein n=1 Tax=Paenibacillus sp. LHD-117 TaxID=3071412 RepID=UPI0027E0A8BF|nr:hypothetical protein [Paenibacillus sp. LHD-117]MDQ6422665.1 hypothetical protein [Paenibacillus sp. LHD-117]